MDIGLTVGIDVDRLSTAPARFDFLEIGVGDGSLPPEDIDPNQVATALDGQNLIVHLPYSQLLTSYATEINDAIVAYQRRLLTAVARLGATKAVIHATTEDRDDVDFRDVSTRQLRRVVEAGRDVGIEVVIENVGHQHHGLQLSILGAIARETDTPICFDIGHAYMEGGNAAIKRFLRSHGDRISHLHCHDVRRRGDTHMPIGAGEVDYTAVSETLGKFDGTVAIEVFTNDDALLIDSAERVAAHLGGSF